MNINFIIDGITSEQMFDEMVRELKLVSNKNQLLKTIRIRWKKSGRVSDPYCHIENVDSDSAKDENLTLDKFMKKESEKGFKVSA
jgi:hypothetical protein